MFANLGFEDHDLRSVAVVRASSAVPRHEAGVPSTVARRRAGGARRPTSSRGSCSTSAKRASMEGSESPGTRRSAGDRSRSRPRTTAGRGAGPTRPAEPTRLEATSTCPRACRDSWRLRFPRGRGQSKAVGIAEIAVQPYEFSRSLNTFFHAIAADEPRGAFPRYLVGEQTYWTPVASAQGGARPALLNEDGMLEVDAGAFSVEPFLFIGEELVSWAGVAPTQELEHGFLPIPSSVWRKEGITLRTTAFATGDASSAVLYVRYRLENQACEARRVRLFAALRPLQVTPPWQAFHEFGGVGRIAALEYASRSGHGEWREAPDSPHDAEQLRLRGFERGSLTHYLGRARCRRRQR